MSKEKSFRTIEMDSESDEDDGETRCVCGSLSDKGLMVQCDKCEAWQHGVCVGFKEEDEVPDNWFCARCEAKLATARPSFSFVEDNFSSLISWTTTKHWNARQANNFPIV